LEETLTIIQILELLESDNSRLFKEEVLRKNAENAELRRFLVLSFDPWKDWGVAKYEKPVAQRPVASSDNIIVKFMDLLERLNARELKGNAAREAVTLAMSEGDALAQKWMERLLWRNLRCGVSVATINKTWTGSVIPFAVSLAETLPTKGSNGEFEITQPVVYPVRVEAKLDGLRCVAVKSKGEVTLYTRSGTVLETLPRIKSAIEALSGDDFVLDGEVMGNDWNESASVVMSSKSKKDDSKMLFHAFDIISIEDWKRQKSETHYRARLLDLQMVLGDTAGTPFRYVKSVMANDEASLREFYSGCLEEGYEGVMLKDIGAPYQWKRSPAILKLKPVATEEGVVVGWYEANANTKRAGQFGGFVVLTPNGVTTRVGGGYTDALKSQIFSEGPDSYVGKIVECEHQPPFTNTGSMRFPVFCRFRDPSDVDPKVLAAYENLK
jgi:DNA ligase-1